MTRLRSRVPLVSFARPARLGRFVPVLALIILASTLTYASVHGRQRQRERIADGPFQPTWNSLAAQYATPEWFRDAKFGIWAHWSAQCVPEQGDWYARNMYIQG